MQINRIYCGITICLMLLQINISRATNTLTSSQPQPMFRSSSSMLHSYGSSSSTFRSGNIDVRNGNTKHYYAPQSTMTAHFAYITATPSMINRSNVSSQFRTTITPTTTATYDLNPSLRRETEDGHNPDPFLPIGDIPCELIAVLISILLIYKHKKRASTSKG